MFNVFNFFSKWVMIKFIIFFIFVVFSVFMYLYELSNGYLMFINDLNNILFGEFLLKFEDIG